VTSGAGWDPATTYPYTALARYAQVRWHGNHATGAGLLRVVPAGGH